MMVPIFGGEVRSGIGSALFGLTIFTEWLPQRSAARCGVHSWSRVGRIKFNRGRARRAKACARPGDDRIGDKIQATAAHRLTFQTKPRFRPGEAEAMEGSGERCQLLRSPSAARFHCDTLSAIMRLDFIAAWLSWA